MELNEFESVMNKGEDVDISMIGGCPEKHSLRDCKACRKCEFSVFYHHAQNILEEYKNHMLSPNPDISQMSGAELRTRLYEWKDSKFAKEFDRQMTNPAFEDRNSVLISLEYAEQIDRAENMFRIIENLDDQTNSAVTRAAELFGPTNDRTIAVAVKDIRFAAQKAVLAKFAYAVLDQLIARHDGNKDFNYQNLKLENWQDII